MHIGQRIHEILIEQQRTPTWFARKICCTRQHVYTIFKKSNVDVELLMRISRALDHNLFSELAEEVDGDTTAHPASPGDTTGAANI